MRSCGKCSEVSVSDKFAEEITFAGAAIANRRPAKNQARKWPGWNRFQPGHRTLCSTSIANGQLRILLVSATTFSIASALSFPEGNA